VLPVTASWLVNADERPRSSTRFDGTLVMVPTLSVKLKVAVVTVRVTRGARGTYEAFR